MRDTGHLVALVLVAVAKLRIGANGFQERPWFITHCRRYLHYQYSGKARPARSSRVYPVFWLVCLVTACTLQGMARVWSGQALA